MSSLPEIPKKVLDVIENCQKQAKDLVDIAKLILSHKKNKNIAFHLAVLALEELGKAEWVFMHHLSHAKDDGEGGFEGKFDDHVKKLFLAIWGPTLGREVVNKGQMEKYENLAKKVHDRRLESLYVNASTDNLEPPKEVEISEVNNLISLAEIRTQITVKPENISYSKDQINDISCYLRITKDPRFKNFVFSKKSMEELAQNGVGKWMKWLREGVEKIEQESQQATENELNRTKPRDSESQNPKWKIRIRLFCGSMSIRGKAFKKWNETCHWIKFESVDKKKNQLFVEITLPLAVPVDMVYSASYSVSIKILLALNIGTLGFFWWYLPQCTDRFYEKLTDLQDPRATVDLTITPALKLNYGRKALEEKDMSFFSQAFAGLSILEQEENKNREAFEAYLYGLKLMSINDVHLRVEHNAYEYFFKALILSMQTFGDWDGSEESFSASFQQVANSILKNEDDFKKLIEIGQAVSKHLPSPYPVTLEEVGMIKILFDAYMLKQFRESLKKNSNNQMEV